MAEYETDEEFFDVLVEPETPKVRLDLTSVKESQEQPTTTPTLPETAANEMFDPNHLQNIGRWLQSICSDDIVALRQTSAYQDFLRAFDRLGRAHRRVVAMNRSIMEVDEVVNEQRKNPSKNMIAHFSFLQQLAGDDVVLRVFEFLECHSLVRTSATCSRFRDLATASATQRTRRIALTRQLDHVMKLLRAKEHVEGVAGSEPHDCHISVPLLGMRQRIIVTDAGDPEYNGIYHCTGTNGNGYVFTKPRNSTSRTTVSEATFTNTEMDFVGIQTTDPILREQAKTLCWDEAVEPGKLLRCIIAKRFSNETILWYMSKEVEIRSPQVRNDDAEPTVTLVFSYWAKLMVVGEAPSEICCGPSITSVLRRSGDPAWQPLSSTRLTHPPTVEVLED